MKKKVFVTVIFVFVTFALLLSACDGQASPPAADPAPPAQQDGQASGQESDPAQNQGPEEAGAEPISIGMLQIFDHPALDAARNGFISGLADEGWIEGVNVIYHPFNAQGDISNANAAAQQIVELDVDLILGIATGTSQALANTTDTIPIVITAVTDPLAAGLIESFERPNTNVTGTSDLAPIPQQINLITRLLPDAQVVGIMYNAGEVNAVIQADMAREAIADLGLEYIPGVAPSTADVAQVVESIIDRVDVIFVPTCNTMAAAYTTIVMIAEERGVPVITAEEGAIPQGALATEGINYYLLGRQSAVMAGQILRGEAIPQEMSIQRQEQTNLVINIAAAERLNIEIPPEMLATAEIVEY